MPGGAEATDMEEDTGVDVWRDAEVIEGDAEGTCEPAWTAGAAVERRLARPVDVGSCPAPAPVLLAPCPSG